MKNLKDKIVKLVIQAVFVPQASYFRTSYFSGACACLGAGQYMGFIAVLLGGVFLDIAIQQRLVTKWRIV